jgi:tripartite-type tricarboxylate transporter receptor subunit TctC
MAACALALPLASAQAADFYAGKKVDFVIGADAGGGYDIYARTIAKHLPRFLPGAPIIVTRNMPGAGSGTAAAFLSRVAPKDGTAIGALFPGVIIGPLLEDRGSNLYDPNKFAYLGTADSGTRVCITGAKSKVKTFADAQQTKVVIGASAAGGSTRDYAFFHAKGAGAKFEIVSGYKGTNDIMLAMERGEVDGVCGLDWTSLKSQRPDWLRDKTINILVQDGLKNEPELDALGVPPVWNFIKNERDKQAIELLISQQVFGRPYIAPPGVAEEQLKVLRDAFINVMKDKDFLHDAENLRLDVAPLPGQDVQDVVAKLYAEPKDVVARAKELIAP